MDELPLGFGFDIHNVDRAALLQEAAWDLDARRGHMGGQVSIQETKEGRQARSMIEDRAEFAQFPDVYRITDLDFIRANRPIPIDLKGLMKQYKFYWIYFPTLLWPRENWAFNKLEMQVSFASGDPAPHLQPKAFTILPEQKFQSVIEAHQSFQVQLDEHGEFSAEVPTLKAQSGVLSGQVGVGVSLKAAAGAGMVIGPFNYSLKRAKIQHTATRLEKVFWRLSGSEFFQVDAPELVVVIQVPEKIKEVTVTAEMIAYRDFQFANAGFQQAVQVLGQKLQEFFKAGAPTGKPDPICYDLTPVMKDLDKAAKAKPE